MSFNQLTASKFCLFVHFQPLPDFSLSHCCLHFDFLSIVLSFVFCHLVISSPQTTNDDQRSERSTVSGRFSDSLSHCFTLSFCHFPHFYFQHTLSLSIVSFSLFAANNNDEQRRSNERHCDSMQHVAPRARGMLCYGCTLYVVVIVDRLVDQWHTR